MAKHEDLEENRLWYNFSDGMPHGLDGVNMQSRIAKLLGTLKTNDDCSGNSCRSFEETLQSETCVRWLEATSYIEELGGLGGRCHWKLT